MAGVWADVGNGLYAAGYVDKSDPLTTLYLFKDMTADSSKLPGAGPPSGSVFLNADDVQSLRVIPTRAPLRYIQNADGSFTPGFFEPFYKVFFRWTDVVRTQDQLDLDPADDPVSPVVDPARILYTIDIAPPGDNRFPF